MQAVQESQTSAVFSIAMVVAYNECIVSQVRIAALTRAVPVILSLLALHYAWLRL